MAKRIYLKKNKNSKTSIYNLQFIIYNFGVLRTNFYRLLRSARNDEQLSLRADLSAWQSSRC